MPAIFVIHENADWSAPLFAALEARGLPYEDWFLDSGCVRLSEPPPEGVFYNRMSASSHTRDHRYAPEYTAATLAWLEGHGRRVLNNSRSLTLEVSKVAQYAQLRAHGIDTPRTIAAVGRAAILDAARQFDGPIILKPNRAGKGAGVQLFRDPANVASHIDAEDYVAPIDGITLLQDYIESPEPFITRVEFVGRQFLYAVRVDTSEGFELCPADACAVGDAFCPTDGSTGGSAGPAGSTAANPVRPKFEIIDGFEHDLLERFPAFMQANGADIAACEVAVDSAGRSFVYDVNMNTNYNSDAEASAGKSGMDRIAEYLGQELAAV